MNLFACLTCGTDFYRHEKRYGNVPYKGLYCEDCDGIEL